MLAYSAVDSVSPAVQRTREFLFRPFRWGTYLKLGLVAIVTEGSSYNLRSGGGGGSSGHTSGINPPFVPSGMQIAGVAFGVVGAILLFAWLYYLLTRLRFSFFHCLLHNTKEIRPGWRLYREPATRFFWLNVVVGLCFLLLIGVLSLPFIAGFWRLFHEMGPSRHLDVGLLLSLILPLIPIIFLLVLTAIAIDVVLRDWMLPHFAVDNANAGEAWAAVWGYIKAEKRQFIVYGLLRLALPFVAMAGVFMVLLIPGLIVAGCIGVLIYAVHSAFAGSAGGAAETGLLVQYFFGAVGFLLMVLACICLGGPVSTGIREYALTFYAGRYPALGDIMYPLTPAPPHATGAAGMA
jgi:hypothetical protein